MSREIVEAVRGLAAEKNISSEKLMEALEDALLSAYKKTPGAAKYAKVEMDRDSGDFKVWELKIPEDLEAHLMIEAYRDRVGELITGIVQQSDSRYRQVQLGERVEALLPKSEQVEGERYDHSQRIKAVIKDVSNSTKGPSIIVSRRDPELIKQLFELEVPEIADGLVEIANVAREPGYRSKIAVISH